MKNNRYFLIILIQILQSPIKSDAETVERFQANDNRIHKVVTYVDYTKMNPKVDKHPKIQQIAVVTTFDKIKPSLRILNQNFLKRRFLFKNEKQGNDFLIKNGIFDYPEKKEERVLLELVSNINPNINLLSKKKDIFGFGSII